jgi:hypothetical protein
MLDQICITEPSTKQTEDRRFLTARFYQNENQKSRSSVIPHRAEYFSSPVITQTARCTWHVEQIACFQEV